MLRKKGFACLGRQAVEHEKGGRNFDAVFLIKAGIGEKGKTVYAGS